MSPNSELAYVSQRFYHKREKRFLKAEYINFSRKYIVEANTSSSKILNFTSNGSVEWVRPVFSRDSKNQMIYEGDIVEGNGVRGSIVWSPKENCFCINNDESNLFLDDPSEYTVVGTVYDINEDI